MFEPLAEKTMEPYAYVYNNPIKMIDPTGMEGESSDSGGGGGEASNGGGGEGGLPGTMGTDRYGNETVNIGYGVNISAGTAAISVSNFGDGSGDSSDNSKTINSGGSSSPENNKGQTGNSETGATNETKQSKNNDGDGPGKGKKGGGDKSARNSSQDKKLSPGEIKKLKEAGWDHGEKGVNGKGGGPKDLYKDKKGNVYEKPKNVGDRENL